MTDTTEGHRVRKRSEREAAHASVDAVDPGPQGENGVDHARGAGVGHVREEGEGELLVKS